MPDFELKSFTADVQFTFTGVGLYDTGYGLRFFPDHVRVEFEDGKVSMVTIFGPRQLASGKPSKATRDFYHWNAYELPDEVPKWVLRAVDLAIEELARTPGQPVLVEVQV